MFGHQDDQQTLNDQAVMASNQSTTNWATDASEEPVSITPDQNTTPLENNEPAAVTPNLEVTKELDSTTLVEADTITDTATTDSLLTIKQQALSELMPIVSHLSQTPTEKFKTLMMMIQASDDQSLIQAAYTAAQQITDDKEKAQALLDVVNEINYFTHPTQINS